MRSIRVIKSSLGGLVIAAALAGPAFANCSEDAQALINNLNGSWRGGGTVQPIGGAKEALSCRVDYNSSTGRVKQSISCTGTEYKFNASADVTCSNNGVSGSWTEKTANNTGRVSGTISGSDLKLEVDGPNFKGRLAARVDSKARHSLTITQFDPAAGRHVPIATVALGR